MTAPTVDAKAHLEGIPEHVYDHFSRVDPEADFGLTMISGSVVSDDEVLSDDLAKIVKEFGTITLRTLAYSLS